jgi:tetratricopeptide (TPR) repeat protein
MQARSQVGPHWHWWSWVRCIILSLCGPAQLWSGCEHASSVVLTTFLSKSQIAIEYSHRIRDSYPQSWVFWVDAKDVASIRASYRKIAKVLRLPGYDEQDTDVLASVRDWLCTETNGPWVMVIDSADDPNALKEPTSRPPQFGASFGSSDLAQVREHMVISRNGAVLITSTNTEAAQMLTGNCAHHIEIGEMNDGESLTLLKSKLHSKVDYTEEEAKDLVKAAEHMPLAISQVAARISMDYPRMTVAQAIEMLNHPEEDVTRLLEGSVHESSRDLRRTNSVVKSWHLSFQYVRENNPSASRLLSLMSLFDRQGIPEALLTGQYGEEATAVLASAPPRLSWWRRLRRRRLRKHKRKTERKASAKGLEKSFDDDWRVLNNLMLIKTNLDGQHFNMHRLIQWTTTRWLEINGELKAWTKKYVSIMRTSFPKPNHDNWKLCLYLFPHAQHTAKYRPDDRKGLQVWGPLIQDIAQFANFMGNYSVAERLGRTALETLEATAGDRNEDTLRCLHQLGVVLSTVQRFSEAEPLLRRAWEGRLSLLSEDHLDTLDSAHMLGSVLNLQKKWNEGEAMQMRAIEGRARVFGPTHIETQSAMSTLAFGYIANGRFEQAEKLHRRVCNIRKDTYGEESDDTYENMRGLAALLTIQGKAHEAEIMHRQVVQVREAKYGLHDAGTIKSINFLGDALVKQDKLDEAAQQYRRVLDVITDLDNSAREEALNTLDSLAQTLSQQGELIEAEAVARLMIDEREKLLGVDHFDTFIGYHTLAETLTLQKQFEPALKMYQKAYVGTLASCGPEHPDTIEFLNDFNCAKNKLLVLPGPENHTSHRQRTPEYVTPPSLAYTFHSPETILV